MAHLLHLSDLHLRADPVEDAIGDAKGTAIPPHLFQTGAARIISTLEALAREIRGDDLAIDCIVVSGDVADRNTPGAYDLLPTVLAPLVPDLVPADRVVVVPGNHDVARRSEPGSTARWENFLKLRAHGYLTPLLEGVDLNDDGTLRGTPKPPVLVATDHSFVIAAMNSANLCQRQLAVEADLKPHLATLESLRTSVPAVAELWEAWDARGAIDPASIGEGQQRAVSAALAAVTRVPPADGDPLRVAVMHHQLLPVGPIAEIKAYETMINLGEVFDWLADNRIDLALHGHKHAGRVYPYEHTAFHKPDTWASHRTLVVSAPTAHAGYEATAPIARLITVDAPQPRTAGVVIRDVPAIEAGGRLDMLARRSTRLRLDPGVALGQISGETADDVHQKLVALAGDYSGLALPLVCRIRDGNSASMIPSTYSDVPEGVTDRQRWFEQTVAWWQHERAGRAADFNHGERLLSYRSGNEAGLNQVERAAKALEHKEVSSRAIAVLVDPTTDLAENDTEFPAFVLVQFAIVDGLLNVTGYFRKQEMPHWWPINVAELGHLQQELILRLSGRGIRTGSISTITMQPVSGDGVPRVAIPSLDSRLDEPHGLLALALPLFHPTAAGVDAAHIAWRLALEDWAPTPASAADGDPMPTLGLTELAVIVGDLAAIYGRDLNDLIDQINLLLVVCQRYAATSEGSRSTARAAWIDQTTQLRAKILDIVARRLSST